MNKEYYNSIYMRRQMVVQTVLSIEPIKVQLKERIRNTYGLGEGGVGPFSIKSYLEYIVKDGVWGDSIMIYLIASMWGLRVTVLAADTCREERFRHDWDLKNVDIGLLFNGSVYCGHYSSLHRLDGNLLDCTSLRKSQGFNQEVDVKERKARGEGVKLREDEVVVTKDRFTELIRKEILYDEIVKVVGGQGISDKEGARTSKKRKLDNEQGRDVSESEQEIELPESVQKVKQGDKYCEVCKKELDDTQQLRVHVRKYHKGRVDYRCHLCNKTFIADKGYQDHLKTHSEGKEFRCDQCEQDFSHKRSYRKHMRDKHENPKVHNCDFCDFHTGSKTNVQQHMRRCDGNPNRVIIRCEICEKPTARYYSTGELMTHKKKKHGW